MTNPNDPAFPTDSFRPGLGELEKLKSGLTKREEFAKAALIARGAEWGKEGFSYEKIAQYAVDQADALIAQLNKDKT